MKKILHILLITFFSFTIISCAQINTLKDDLGSKYDDLSSGSEETAETASEAPTAIPEGTRPLFVSVGSSGTIIISSNGTKWTRSTSGTKVKLRAVTYGNDAFVAVGFSGTILTSSDGNKWTKRKSGTKKHLGNVAFGNDTFVAVGNNGTVLTSPDGTSWTKRRSRTKTSLYGVAYGNDTFVAV